MFLTRKTIRTIKSVISEIPGAPGSSRLGEAIAAGFGFADYHDMKQELDALDADLRVLPAYLDLDGDQMSARLREFGYPDDLSDLISATAEHCFYGEGMLDFRETGSGIPVRVARFDLTTPAWRERVLDMARVMASLSGQRSWSMEIPELLAFDDSTPEFDHERHPLFVRQDGEVDFRPLSESDFGVIDRLNEAMDLHPRHILENALLMGWDVIPGTPPRRIVLDGQGVRIACGNEIVLLLADADLQVHSA